MTKLSVEIPEILDFPRLQLSRTSDGALMFNWDPIREICTHNGLDFNTTFLQAPQDNISNFIQSWYVVYSELSGKTDPTMEALIAETKSEMLMEELQIPIKYKTHLIQPQDCAYTPIYMRFTPLPMVDSIQAAEKALDTYDPKSTWYPSPDRIAQVIKLAGPTSRILHALRMRSARTINHWKNGEREMSYPTWRALLELAGEPTDPLI